MRNRYVDFLRAVSICVVVLGHWLMSMPALIDGELRAGEILRVELWVQWLTWAFQVMPVFFVVGGYSNAVSWRSAQRKNLGYGDWASARLRRLVSPLLPLVLFWVLLAVAARQLDVPADLMRSASQVALIPIWFLAVYLLVTIATPLTYRLYRDMGFASFGLFAIGAVVVDLLAFSQELPTFRWANYAFVWLAVHQLGFMWQDTRLAGPGKALPWALGGLALLVLLVSVAGYPISMLSVPGEAVSNSRPPTLALLALGALHAGLLLSLEAPVRRWLQRELPWTLTVLINSRIMTLYLWHLTVMVALIGVAIQLEYLGLKAEPGSAAWWLSRLPWSMALLTVMLVFVVMLGRYEQPRKRQAGAVLSTWRVITGSTLLSLGLALTATGGISDGGAIGVRLVAVLPTLAGALLVLLPRRSGKQGSG